MSRQAKTVGELRRSGYRPRSVRQEIRANLVRKLAAKETLFPGVLGYERTVIPGVVNALLAGHDFILLGLRGQAKTRILRALTDFLDPEVPVLAGSEVNDDPLAPLSTWAERRLPPVRAAEAAAAPAMSVFDRLRAKKAAASEAVPAADVEPAAPKPATLDDVANAIAAARTARETGALQAFEAEPVDAPEVANAETPPLVVGEEGWKRSVVMSINDTREELKRAHQSVSRLRRQLTEIDRRRLRRRQKISASLDRAESLLSEFQNAWR